MDYDTQLELIAQIVKEEGHELPDGNISTDGAERFRFVEVLFQLFPRIYNTSLQSNIECNVYIREIGSLGTHQSSSCC